MAFRIRPQVTGDLSNPMPYRVLPDGTIETDTVDEAIGVAKSIAVDSILGIRYSRGVDPTEEFLRITDEIVKLVQQKSGVEAEIEVLLQRQRELLSKKDKPKSPPTYRDRSKPRPAPIVEPKPDYFAVVGLEILHEGDTHRVGDEMVVHKWGDRNVEELTKRAKESLDFFGVQVDLRTIKLTQRQVEALRAGPDLAVRCSDFGIEVP